MNESDADDSQAGPHEPREQKRDEPQNAAGDEIFCPSCAAIFPSDASCCPVCRRCPSCGAQLLRDPAQCPSCEYPADEERLSRARKTLDPHAPANRRVLARVRRQQQHRDLMSRLHIVRMIGLLVVPVVVLQLVAVAIAAVAPIDFQWLAGLAFIIAVPGGFAVALAQLRRGRWRWLLKRAE